MNVSIPIDSETSKVVDHNVVDETRKYDKEVGGVTYATYETDADLWQDDEKTYAYAGDTFIPVEWVLLNEADYEVDQVVFKDGLTQKVTSKTTTDVAQQPEAYTVTAGSNFDAFTERYNKLRTGLTLPFNSFWDMVVGDTKHSLYQTPVTESYPYGWIYRVSWTSFYNVWSATEYSSSYRIVSTLTTATDAKNIKITWNGAIVYDSSSSYHQITIGTTFTGTDGRKYKCIEEKYHDPAETTDGYTTYTWGTEQFSAVLPTYYVLGDGVTMNMYWNGTLVVNKLIYAFPSTGDIYTVGSDRYKVGAWQTADGGTAFYGIYKETSTYNPATTEPYDIYYYSLQQEQQASKTVYQYQSARLTYESSLNVFEDTAYSFSTPTSSMWVGRHFIVRGTDLYVRTQTTDPMISVEEEDKQYQVIEALSEFPHFNEVGVTNYLKPLDLKNYTAITQLGTPPIYYKLQSTSDRFDTVALSNLICDDITLVFKDADDIEVARIDSFTPNTHRDITVDESGIKTNVLPPHPTTVILYSTADNIIPIGGYVEIYLSSGSQVTLGTIKLGLSVSAGFTNLVFTNKFNDWSPREVDQWGNVSYISGVKANVFSGTVDVLIDDYDMTTRLMTSIGGSTVIINGSDAKDNKTPDNDGIFASTMLIGRLKDFQLKTKIADADMDVTATYAITVEENI